MTLRYPYSEKITLEEELELGHRYQNGDLKAGKEIIMRNIPYVINFSRRYAFDHIDRTELIAEGIAGLVEAMPKYDLTREKRFITYARYHVIDRMARYVTLAMQNGRHGAKKFKRIQWKFLTEKRRTENDVAAEFGKSPTHLQSEIFRRLAERFDVDEETIREMDTMIRDRDSPLDTCLTRKPKGTKWNAYVPAGRGPTTEKLVAEKELYSHVHKAISHLDPREQRIIEEYILSDEGRTLTSLGKELGVSKQWAKQLRDVALEKLREILEPTIRESGFEEQYL